MRDLTKCEVELYFAWHGAQRGPNQKRYIRSLIRNRKMVLATDKRGGGKPDPFDDSIWLVGNMTLTHIKELNELPEARV